ncbi:MAG TPA: type II CAAX endopeptidase family protein [Actinomycetes bacterium]|nr:type II CAAX endopeptidase family protein [Actinomycetes bacterium]
MADFREQPALEAPDPPAQDPRRWGLGDCLITVGLWFFFIAVALEILPPVDGTEPVNVRAWSAVGLIALPWLGLAGWPLLATRLKGRGPVEDLRLRLTWRDAGFGVLGGVAGLLVASAVAAVQENLTGHGISSSAGNAFDSLKGANPLPLLVFALLAGVGAPIVEEIGFRGLFFGALEKRGMRPVWCVLVTAVAFTLFHAEATRILVLLPIAVALGVVRAWTGSTGASIVAHMTNNVPAAIGMAISAVR